jgi:hypothetical protein
MTRGLNKSALLGRRRFLECAGATAATLPFLRALPSYAQANDPKLILAFSGNGRIRHLWGGEDTGSGFTLRQNLAPLQPWASNVTIAENLYNPAASLIGGTHEGGTKTLFTGGGAAVGSDSAGAGGPSIDTLFMAQQSGTAKNTSFYQQVVAERNSAESAGPNNRLVFDSTGAAREPYRSSWEAVDGYLADFVGGGAPAATGPSSSDLARTKLFETLNAQLGELEGQLCSEDYYQMGAMREAVAQASSSMQLVVDCELPDLPARPDLPDYEPIWQPPTSSIDLSSSSDWYFLRARLSIDLMVMALACGVTRSGVLQFDQAAGEAQAVGHPLSHHNQSHETPTSLQPFLVDHPWESEANPFYYSDFQHDPPAQVISQYQASWDLLTEWELYYAEHMAYMMRQLDAFGLTADTAILWGSEIDLGGAHSHLSMPSVLISGENLPFARGKSVRYAPTYADDTQDIRSPLTPDGPARNHNDLLRTVLNGLGVDATSVGTASYNQGPLDELLA